MDLLNLLWSLIVQLALFTRFFVICGKLNSSILAYWLLWIAKTLLIDHYFVCPIKIQFNATCNVYILLSYMKNAQTSLVSFCPIMVQNWFFSQDTSFLISDQAIRHIYHITLSMNTFNIFCETHQLLDTISNVVKIFRLSGLEKTTFLLKKWCN